MTTKQRFLAKVNKTATCWLWKGGSTPDGYGRFWVNGRLIGPHRYSYELHKDKIPEAMYLDHLCRTPSCVNPEHLEPVTNRENQTRGSNILKKKSGLPVGVTRSRGKYKAAALINGVHRTLGRFDTPGLAHKAYLEAI